MNKMSYVYILFISVSLLQKLGLLGSNLFQSYYKFVYKHRSWQSNNNKTYQLASHNHRSEKRLFFSQTIKKILATLCSNVPTRDWTHAVPLQWQFTVITPRPPGEFQQDSNVWFPGGETATGLVGSWFLARDYTSIPRSEYSLNHWAARKSLPTFRVIHTQHCRGAAYELRFYIYFLYDNSQN